MTDTSKHTPGPWTLETVTTSCGVCHKIGPFPWVDYDDKKVQNYACVYVDYGKNGDELLANARLIAAAPDLLDALKDIQVDFCEEKCTPLEDGDHWEECSTMTALIAKAEGE